MTLILVVHMNADSINALLAAFPASDFYLSRQAIQMKLRWAELSGGSLRHFNDALGVYETQREILDLDYLNEWAKRLGVQTSWGRLLAEAIPTSEH